MLLPVAWLNHCLRSAVLSLINGCEYHLVLAFNISSLMLKENNHAFKEAQRLIYQLSVNLEMVHRL